jgi:hypothetical protein
VAKYCWANTAHEPGTAAGSIETDEKSPNRFWPLTAPVT